MNSKITGITIVKLSTAAKSDLMYEQQCTGAATVSTVRFAVEAAATLSSHVSCFGSHS